MIDTPGIPDPDPGRTSEHYDDIVRTVQKTGGLNAFIMVLSSTTDREHMRKDAETYRVLLKPFEKLQVSKIVVCRVRPDLWATPDQRKQNEVNVREWVSNVMHEAGMASAEQVYIREDETMAAQYFALRSFVTDRPWTPVVNWKTQTYAELVASQKEGPAGTNNSLKAGTPTDHPTQIDRITVVEEGRRPGWRNQNEPNTRTGLNSQTGGDCHTEPVLLESQEGPRDTLIRSKACTTTEHATQTGCSTLPEEGPQPEGQSQSRPDTRTCLHSQTEGDTRTELQEEKRFLESEGAQPNADVITLEGRLKGANIANVVDCCRP